MGVAELLLLLCGVSLAIQEAQGSLGLSVSPPVTATCGETVTLHCDISHYQDGLQVKHLSWIHNSTVLCVVNSSEQPPTPSTEGVQCSYVGKRLSVTFRQKSPQQSHGSENYICKLRANQGSAHKNTSVKSKGCSQRVEEAPSLGDLSCTFTGVFPRARGSYPVHWLHGADRLTESNARIKTENSVDPDCCITVHSTLKANHTGPFNCSLWDEGLQMYTLTKVAAQVQSGTLARGGAAGMLGPQWGIWTLVIVSVLSMSSSSS